LNFPPTNRQGIDFRGKGIPMRTYAHYLFATAAMTFYGGQVCPLVASLDIVRWLSMVATIFGVTFLIRKFLIARKLSTTALENQTQARFLLEFFAFVAVGILIAAYNGMVHDFPAISGFKMLTGCVTLGFFAAADLALEQERTVMEVVKRSGREIKSDGGYFPLAGKFCLVAIASVVFITSIIFWAVVRDLDWIMELGPDGYYTAKEAFRRDVIFICLAIGAEIVNLILAYARNLKLFFGNQNLVLAAVADGNLATRVPVGTRDEFGIMARFTNKMVSDLDARNKELQATQLEIVKRLGRAAEYRDNETGLHVVRMSLFSARLARAAGWDAESCERLLHASPMHDIGKIGIPDRILLKPGKLEGEEWEIMKTHAAIGGEILRGGNSELLKMAETIALTHQEKWDGSGYPNGLKGAEIPLLGRITAICDVFDALTSERPYKKAWRVEDAVSLIEKESGRHFDPHLVRLFKQILPDIVEIKNAYAENHSPVALVEK
jgi:HD-GYP domain-containing protein (c-di-GMP phosphodiesterase class II)